MADVDNYLTLREAAEVSGVGYQTLLAATKTGSLKVAKWTMRGEKKAPLLVDRDDVMEFKANRPGRGFIPFANQYERLMERLSEALTENQINKVREVFSEDDYRKMHYGA